MFNLVFKTHIRYSRKSVVVVVFLGKTVVRILKSFKLPHVHNYVFSLLTHQIILSLHLLAKGIKALHVDNVKCTTLPMLLICWVYN